MTTTTFEINPTGAGSLERADLVGYPVVLPWFVTTTSATISSTWNDRLADLRRLKGLEQDWDGEGAVPVDLPTVTLAEVILSEVRVTSFNTPPSRIDALSDGSILIVWNNGISGYFEAEISSQGRVSLMYLPPLGNALHQAVLPSASRSKSNIVEDRFVEPAATVAPRVFAYGT